MAIAFHTEPSAALPRWVATGGPPPPGPVDAVGRGASRGPVVERHPVRVGVAAAVLLVVLSMASSSGVSVLAGLVAGARPAPEATTDVSAEPGAGAAGRVVAAGETLWSIAAGLAPGDDDAAAYHELVRLNGTESVAVGERVRLPA